MVVECDSLAECMFSLCAHIDFPVGRWLAYLAKELQRSAHTFGGVESCLWLEQAVSTSVSKGTIG